MSILEHVVLTVVLSISLGGIIRSDMTEKIMSLLPTEGFHQFMHPPAVRDNSPVPLLIVIISKEKRKRNRKNKSC